MRFILIPILILSLLCPAKASYPLVDNTIFEIQEKLDSIVIVTSKTSALKKVSGKRRNIVTYTRKGAGVIIKKNGLIATNTHLIRESDNIKVTTSSGISYDADIVKVDPSYDISIIKIRPEKDTDKFAAIDLAVSDDLELCEPVYTVSSSIFLNGTISQGRIISIGSLPGDKNDEIDLIKTDIALYGGDSGGPLLINGGKLAGLLYAGGTKDGKKVTLAVPSNKIKHLLVS